MGETKLKASSFTLSYRRHVHSLSLVRSLRLFSDIYNYYSHADIDHKENEKLGDESTVPYKRHTTRCSRGHDQHSISRLVAEPIIFTLVH